MKQLLSDGYTPPPSCDGSGHPESILWHNHDFFATLGLEFFRSGTSSQKSSPNIFWPFKDPLSRLHHQLHCCLQVKQIGPNFMPQELMHSTIDIHRSTWNFSVCLLICPILPNYISTSPLIRCLRLSNCRRTLLIWRKSLGPIPRRERQRGKTAQLSLV